MLLYPSLDSTVSVPLYTPVLFMLRASENELPSTPEGSPDGSFSGMSGVGSIEDDSDVASFDERGNLGSDGGLSASTVEKLQLQYWTSLPTASGGGDGIGGWGAIPMQILKRGGGVSSLGIQSVLKTQQGGESLLFEEEQRPSAAIRNNGTSNSNTGTGGGGIGGGSTTSSSSIVFAASLVFPLSSGSFEATARVGIASDVTASETSGAWRWLGKPNDNTKLLVQPLQTSRHRLLPDPSYKTMSRLSEAMTMAAIALSKQSQAALLLKGAGGQRRNSYGSSRSYMNENLAATAAAASAAAAAATNPSPLKPLSILGSGRSYHLPVQHMAVQLPSISHHQALLLDSLALSPSTLFLPKRLNTDNNIQTSTPPPTHQISVHSPQIRAAALASSASSPNLLISSSSSSSSAGALRHSFAEPASVVYNETAASLSMRATPPQGSSTQPTHSSPSMNSSTTVGLGQASAITAGMINEIAYVSALISILVSNWASTSSNMSYTNTTTRNTLGSISKRLNSSNDSSGSSERAFTALVQLIACLPVLRQPAVRSKFVSKILGIEASAATLLLEGISSLPIEVVLSMTSPARETRIAARRTTLCKAAIATAVSTGSSGGIHSNGLGYGGLGGTLNRTFKQFMSVSSSSSAASTQSPKSSSDSPKASGGIMSTGVSPYLGPTAMSPYLGPESPIASIGGRGGGGGPYSPNPLEDEKGRGGGGGVNALSVFPASPVKPFVLSKLPPVPLLPLISNNPSSSTISYPNTHYSYVSLDDIDDVFDEDGLEDADIMSKLSPHTAAIMTRRIAALRKSESKVISRTSSRASMKQRPSTDVPRSPARGIGGGTVGGGGTTFDNIDIDNFQSFPPSEIHLALPPSLTTRSIQSPPSIRGHVSAGSSLTASVNGGIAPTSPLMPSLSGYGRPPLHSDALFMLPAATSPVAASPRNLTMSSSRPPVFLSPSSSGTGIHNIGSIGSITGGGGGPEKRILNSKSGGGNINIDGTISSSSSSSSRPFETTFFCSVMSTRQRALLTLVEWASGPHWRLLEVARASDGTSSTTSTSTQASDTHNGSNASLISVQDQLEAMSLELCINALHHISPAYVHKRTVELIVSRACTSRSGTSARIFLTRAIRILFGKGAVCGPEPVLMRACYPVLVTALPSSAGGRGVGGGGGAAAAAAAASTGLSTCITLRAVPNLSRVVAQCISESLFTHLYENQNKKNLAIVSESLFSPLEINHGNGTGGNSMSEQLIPSPPPPSHVSSLSPPHTALMTTANVTSTVAMATTAAMKSATEDKTYSPRQSGSGRGASSRLSLSINLPHLPARALDFRENAISSPIPISLSGAVKNSPSSPLLSETSTGLYHHLSPSRKVSSTTTLSDVNVGHLCLLQKSNQTFMNTSKDETNFDFSVVCALMADLVLSSCVHSSRTDSAASTSSIFTSSTMVSPNTVGFIPQSTTSGSSPHQQSGHGHGHAGHAVLVKRRSGSRANMVASPPRDQNEMITFPVSTNSQVTNNSSSEIGGVKPIESLSPISAILLTGTSVSSALPPRLPSYTSTTSPSSFSSSSSSSPPFSSSTPPPGHGHQPSSENFVLSASLQSQQLQGNSTLTGSTNTSTHQPNERLTRLWSDATRALALASLSLPVVPDAGVGTTPEFRSVASCALRICAVNETLRDVFLSSLLKSWPTDASDSEAALLEMIHQVLQTSPASTTTSSLSMTISASAAAMAIPPRVEGILLKKLVSRLCRSLRSAHIRTARNALIVLFSPALQITRSTTDLNRSGGDGDQGQGQNTCETDFLKKKIAESLTFVSDKHWNPIVRLSSAQHLSVLVGE
jgi:hypothetical protein